MDDSVQSVKNAEGSNGIQILPKPDPDAEARHWAKGELQAIKIKAKRVVKFRVAKAAKDAILGTK